VVSTTQRGHAGAADPSGSAHCVPALRRPPRPRVRWGRQVRRVHPGNGDTPLGPCAAARAASEHRWLKGGARQLGGGRRGAAASGEGLHSLRAPHAILRDGLRQDVEGRTVTISCFRVRTLCRTGTSAHPACELRGRHATPEASQSSRSPFMYPFWYLGTPVPPPYPPSDAGTQWVTDPDGAALPVNTVGAGVGLAKPPSGGGEAERLLGGPGRSHASHNTIRICPRTSSRRPTRVERGHTPTGAQTSSDVPPLDEVRSCARTDGRMGPAVACSRKSVLQGDLRKGSCWEDGGHSRKRAGRRAAAGHDVGCGWQSSTSSTCRSRTGRHARLLLWPRCDAKGSTLPPCSRRGSGGPPSPCQAPVFGCAGRGCARRRRPSNRLPTCPNRTLYVQPALGTGPPPCQAPVFGCAGGVGAPLCHSRSASGKGGRKP